MLERGDIEKPGTIVTFEHYGDLMVATYAPGAVRQETGELVEFGWVDSYGGTWNVHDILGGEPTVVHAGTERESSDRG